jgi:predicted AlkP superfamily pyrophosphatase or phosphodiesterase
MDPLLLINIAGLGHSCIGDLTPNLVKLAGQGSGVVPVQPPVPALTSSSQASLLTGAAPSEHGIVANGWYFRELAQVLNWQRSANLVSGEPLWEAMRARDPAQKSANLFWRYAAHSTCDVNVMERPTYWADGRKGQDIYSEPGSVRDELVKALGPFPLFRFWGPAAGIQATQWIVDATVHLLKQSRYGLVLTYLPHLDYDHQRFGPNSEQGKQALRDLDVEAGRLIDEAQRQGMRIAVVSDYAFENVSRPVYLNRALRKAGYINVQLAENGELLEHGASRAFAVCDQQIAHVYVNDPSDIVEVQQLLEDLDGVEQVLDAEAMQQLGIAHSRAGELLAIAEEGCWFTYHYWLDESKAPDFANCVAIHAKPGWDPVELFLAPGLGGKLHLAKRILQSKLGLRAPFDVIADDATLIRGSHGRIPICDAQRAVLITSWDCQQSGAVAMEKIKSILMGEDG